MLSHRFTTSLPHSRQKKANATPNAVASAVVAAWTAVAASSRIESIFIYLVFFLFPHVIKKEAHGATHDLKSMTTLNIYKSPYHHDMGGLECYLKNLNT